MTTVRNPQADAERRRTFSPPILEDRKRVIKNERRAKGQSPPQSRLKCASQFSLFLRSTLGSNLFFSSYRCLYPSRAHLTSSLPTFPGAGGHWHRSRQDTGHQRCPSNSGTHHRTAALTEGKPELLSPFCFS